MDQIIAVDFDGTLCKNQWPGIGAPNRKLINYLIDEKETRGSKLILWTCRTGALLDEAVEWCRQQGLEFDVVNDNLSDRIEIFGDNCRKIFANVYIDDRSQQPFW